MTPKEEGGVVDPSLVVVSLIFSLHVQNDSNRNQYGTSNVRVADLSVIANIPGIRTVSREFYHFLYMNDVPTLLRIVAYMIAERAAEIIKAQV